ncbi:MAG: hypothetical protein IJC35_04635 [Oscillospiraceae bacterium]|nr:hypothetical protein [Oscillospiraceae bacterium]
MTKIDKIVLKETKYIAVWELILSLLMHSVFLILDKWDLTVLWGNLLSGAASVLNFFIMGLHVQNALSMEQDDAKKAVKASQTTRNFIMFAVAVIGIVLPCFNIWAAVIPIFFPRIAIIFRPAFDKKDAPVQTNGGDTENG